MITPLEAYHDEYGGIKSTLGDVQYTWKIFYGFINDVNKGTLRGDHDIPQCTEHLPLYSYLSWCTHDIPLCTADTVQG